jgi:acyl carrier protein
MTHDEIVKNINAVFEESFEIEPERLVPEANVFLDLGLDSLDTVDLVVAIQKRFGVQVRDDERVRAIRTLADVYAFIATIQKEQDA